MGMINSFDFRKITSDDRVTAGVLCSNDFVFTLVIREPLGPYLKVVENGYVLS